VHRILSPTAYTIVCAILVVLTFATVSISFAPLPGAWHLVLGLIIALCKASLVVLFFMHLIVSPRLTWAVVAVACFWLGILVVLTLTDYVTRGMGPYIKGQ
jgi:cytochrome c oxidase subunit 4